MKESPFESEWGYNMDTTFKYKDKIITTPNLEKKLKRMKISLEDIEIIETPKLKEKQNSAWEFEGIKEWKYYKHPDSDIRHCCLIDKGTNPSKYDLLKNLPDDYVEKCEMII